MDVLLIVVGIVVFFAVLEHLGWPPKGPKDPGARP